ncbi:MAG: competence/damage-inducible protein A [candidate division WOR-3 bacterium]
MECELIVIGDELLRGSVIDTNSAFIARRLAELGIGIKRVVRVGDDEKDIQLALAESLTRVRLIIITGGLGPTDDDRTLMAVCGLINRPLRMDSALRKRIQLIFEKRKVKMPKLAEKQAYVPQGVTVFPNPIGMVPGMAIEHQGSIIILLPGVPQEVEALFNDGIVDYLKNKIVNRERIYTALVRTFGLIESQLAPKLEKNLKKFFRVQIGYYPSVSGLDLVFSGPDEFSVKNCASFAAKLLGDNVYALSDKSLVQIVGELLRKNRLTVATAESCTGGLVGDLITSVPGSSDYFRGGIIAYANDIKVNLLGVSKLTLERYGAVSQETVNEMLKGVIRITGADCAVAVSGIAGPGGGTKSKPVGWVYIGVLAGKKKRVLRCIFSGTRSLIKQRAAWTAIDQLRRILNISRCG